MNHITIGIPVYNEEETLKESLDSIVLSASKINASYDISLCFNGTTDNGLEIAKNFNKTVHPIKILESAKGKPFAIRELVKSSFADIMIFCDADIIVDKNCFKRIIDSYTPEIMAVTGRPIPNLYDSFIYKIINVRMLHQDLEIAKNPINGTSQKPFLHGRIYSTKRNIFCDISDNFQNSIGDDTFLSHYLLLKYGRESIFCCKDAYVYYQPVRSIASWWYKWSRIWSDLDKLYKNNKEFVELKDLMKTKIDWDNVPIKEMHYFVLERILHHSAYLYFNLAKHFKDFQWMRLKDTKGGLL